MAYPIALSLALKVMRNHLPKTTWYCTIPAQIHTKNITHMIVCLQYACSMLVAQIKGRENSCVRSTLVVQMKGRENLSTFIETITIQLFSAHYHI